MKRFIALVIVSAACLQAAPATVSYAGGIEKVIQMAPQKVVDPAISKPWLNAPLATVLSDVKLTGVILAHVTKVAVHHRAVVSTKCAIVLCKESAAYKPAWLVVNMAPVHWKTIAHRGLGAKTTAAQPPTSPKPDNPTAVIEDRAQKAHAII